MTPLLARRVLMVLLLLTSAVETPAAGLPRLPSQGSHFLALTLPSTDRPLVERFLTPLRADVPDLDWTAAEKLHLTLAYLGPLDRAARVRLMAVMEEELSELPPFELGFEGLGTFTFSRTGSPRVLWARPVGDSDALGRLAAACRRAVRRATDRDDSLPFVPHMTLGKARDPRQGRRLAATGAAGGSLATPSRPVTEAVLLRGGSMLDRGRYTVLARFRLREPGSLQP